MIDTIEGQKLLARREPGDQQQTGDMLLIEGTDIVVPAEILAKNSSVDSVKAMFNRLAGLTSLAFEPGTENASKYRPRFRDLMAFVFQPQNIIANPDVLFFKADTTEHREKLKTIFPYILGAITVDVLHARFELDRLGRILRRKEAELRDMVGATTAWRLEAQAWVRQAVEFGLLPAEQLIPSDWLSIVDVLRSIVTKGSKTAEPSLAGIDVALSRLSELRQEESSASALLTEHRSRLNELRRLLESSEAYGGALRIQRDRLSLADWMRV